jgi:hypothetical protein
MYYTLMDLYPNEKKPVIREHYEALASKVIDGLMRGELVWWWDGRTGDFFPSTLIVEPPSEKYPVKKFVEDGDYLFGDIRGRKDYEEYAKGIIDAIMRGEGEIRWENNYEVLIIEGKTKSSKREQVVPDK